MSCSFLYQALCATPLTQYLEAIGLSSAAAANREPDLAWLQQLYVAHITSLPFNAVEVFEGGKLIDLQVGKPTTAAAHKLFRRGGICFEMTAVVLNSLRELGFTAYRCAGEVYTPVGGVTPPLVHASIIVVLDGQRYLMDVGMPLGPFGIVKLEEGTVQTMSNGSQNVMTCLREEGQPMRWVLNRVDKEGKLVPIHRFQQQEYTDAGGELSAARDWLYVDAESPFRHGWMLQIYRPDGTCVTLAEGSWAGAGVPPGQAKYVVRPPPKSGGDETITYLPTDGEEVARLFIEEFHVRGQVLPVKKGAVEGVELVEAAPVFYDLVKPLEPVIVDALAVDGGAAAVTQGVAGAAPELSGAAEVAVVCQPEQLRVLASSAA